jgi:hypothetical protein
VVPIGGDGWGWGLLARFTLMFGLFTNLAHLPINPLSPWLFKISYGLTTYLADTFRILPHEEANGRFYQHFVPFAIAAIWLMLDRKRKREVLIHEVGQVLARYGIAYILSSYALEKTFGLQGSGTYLSYGGLLPLYGAMTRQFATFLWLGHSLIYENFAALVELAPLMLIPFRRVAVWGAIVAFMACLNVFIVNTGHWNVSLSLTPIAMVAMPIALLIPHTKRFFQLFIGQPVEPLRVGYLTPPSWYWPVGAITKTVVIVWSLYSHNHFEFAGGHYSHVSALGGLYEVERFTRNGRVEPLAAEFPERWREVAIGRAAGELSFLTVDGKRVSLGVQGPLPTQPERLPETYGKRWAAKTSEPEGDLPFVGPGQTTGLEHGTMIPTTRKQAAERLKKPWKPERGTLHYTHPTPGEVTLSGVIGTDTIEARLRRKPIDSLPLYRHRWYPEHWRNVFASWMREHGVIYPF